MPFISGAHSFGDSNKMVEMKCGVLLSCANTQFSAIAVHTHASLEPQRESGKMAKPNKD